MKHSGVFPALGAQLGFEPGLTTLGKAVTTPPPTFQVQGWAAGCLAAACCLLGPSAVREHAALNSLSSHFLVNSSCPGQGREARHPLILPVGGWLNQDLPPVLASLSLPSFLGILAGI